MTVKYMAGDFEHPEKFGFTGSAGKAHVKPHVRKAPARAPKQAASETFELPVSMQPMIAPLSRR
jgi:hypothetical protein